MQGLKLLFIFLGMLLLFGLLFGSAYLLWHVNQLLALVVLFLGIAFDLAGGFVMLDRMLSHI